MLSRSLAAVLAAVLLVVAGARAAPAQQFALDGIASAIPCDAPADLMADCDDGAELRLCAAADPESPDRDLDAALGGGWNELPRPECLVSLAGAAERRHGSMRLRACPARGPPHRVS